MGSRLLGNDDGRLSAPGTTLTRSGQAQREGRGRGPGFRVPACAGTSAAASAAGNDLSTGSGQAQRDCGAELVAGYVGQELFGGLDPLAGPEAPDDAVHDVQQEADDGLALVGALADDARDTGVVGEGWRGECRGEVFEGFVAPRCVGAAGVRGWVPAFAGTTVVGRLVRRSGWHWTPANRAMASATSSGAIAWTCIAASTLWHASKPSSSSLPLATSR